MFMILRCIGASGTTGASTTRDKKQEKAQEDLSKQLQNTKRYEKHDHMLQGKLLQKYYSMCKHSFLIKLKFYMLTLACCWDLTEIHHLEVQMQVRTYMFDSS